MTPGEWLELFYSGAAHGWLTISFKRDAAARGTPNDPFDTEWFHITNRTTAAERITSLSEDHNVYFGMALRRERLPDRQRGCSEDVIAIPCLWAELDVAGPGHSSGKTYFKTKAAALKFLNAQPRTPSIVVDSGGGLHAYWMLRELWELDDDEREYAAALMRGWQSFLRSKAHELGATIDSTHDLARVLRVPGTYNRKSGKVVAVEVVASDGKLYNPGDFDEWQDYSETQKRGVPMNFVLSASPQPPAFKYATLRENDKKFRDTLDGKRRDLKDDSQSAICMALANITAAAGWTDQEIVDLLASYRAKVGAKYKPAGWYARTIEKARTRKGANGNSHETAQTVARIASSPEPDEKLAGLSELLGFRVRRFVQKRPPDPSSFIQSSWYVIETDLGFVEVPDAEFLMTQRLMRALIVDKLRHQIKVPAKEWTAVIDALLAVCVLEDAPQEASEHQEIREALAEYCERRGVTDSAVNAHDNGSLLRKDDRLYFGLGAFAEWCRVRKHMKVGTRNLPSLLEAIGCKRLKIDNLPRDGKRTSIVVWSVP